VAEASCTHSVVVQDILADDFQGTSPDGKRYSKKEAVEEAKTSKVEARDCHLDDAKVHFFGDNTALVYGQQKFNVFMVSYVVALFPSHELLYNRPAKKLAGHEANPFRRSIALCRKP